MVPHGGTGGGGEDSHGGVAASESPEEAFAALGHQTRLDVLRTLWEAYDPASSRGVPPPPEPMSYSELLERLDVDDHGQLNYHLTRLVGRFVSRTSDGYLLTGAGRRLVVAITGGSMVEYPAVESTEVAISCPLCDAPVVASYDDGRMRVNCSECPGFATPNDDRWGGSLWNFDLPPHCLENRTLEEVIDVAHGLALQGVQARLGGTCPDCTGQVRLSVRACTDHQRSADGLCERCDRRDLAELVFVCESCRAYMVTGVGHALYTHPAVVSFYHDHGVDLRESPYEVIRRVNRYGEALRSADPLRVRVTIPADDDALTVVVDDALDVVSVATD